MLSKIKDDRLTTEFVRQWCDILFEITRVIVVKMVAKEMDGGFKEATPQADKLQSMIPDMGRLLEGVKYKESFELTDLDTYICLFNKLLNLFPAAKAQHATGKLQFEIIKSICKVVDVWATVIAPELANSSHQQKIMDDLARYKGRDKSGREKMANFSIEVLHKISPSTILTWFGPWLFTFAKGGSSLDGSHHVDTKTRATALKWICMLICLQSDKDPKREHVVELCALINNAMNLGDQTLIGTIIDNTAGMWGRSLSGMTAILSVYVKCVVFVLKDRRDFFSEENRVSMHALSGATSIVCFTSRFTGLDREILPSAKNPMHRPSLQTKLSNISYKHTR